MKSPLILLFTRDGDFAMAHVPSGVSKIPRMCNGRETEASRCLEYEKVKIS